MQIDTHITDIIENYIIDNEVIDTVIPAWTWNALSVMLTKNEKFSVVSYVHGIWHRPPLAFVIFMHLEVRLRAVILAEFRKFIARAANHHISVTVQSEF